MNDRLGDGAGGGIAQSTGGTEHKQEYECVACDDFELTKAYSGQAGTRGRKEYDQIEAPNVCPACGGRVELIDEVVR